jgi:hypothetical protein
MSPPLTTRWRRSRSPRPATALRGQVDGYPAGSAAYWLRKRLDTRGVRTKITRIPQATLWSGVGVLLAVEAVDAIRVLRRRAAHLAAEWWAGVERQERREARRAEIMALAIPLIRRRG